MPFLWTDLDGRPGRALAWRSENPRAALIAVHGLSGAAEQFGPLASALPGFSIYGVELRGQGSDENPARRGALLDLPGQFRNLDLFLEAVTAENPGRPVFFIGESMGALLTAAYLAERQAATVRGAIFSVPVVALRRPVPPWIRQIVRLTGFVAPALRTPPSVFVNGKTSSPPLTRNREYQDSLKSKPHHLRAFTFRFLTELGDLIHSSGQTAARLRTPSLTLAAGQDCFVRPDQVEAWHQKIPAPDKTLRLYPEAYHLLWHDWDRDLVLTDIATWLEARL